jgi:hypothetical protein
MKPRRPRQLVWRAAKKSRDERCEYNIDCWIASGPEQQKHDRPQTNCVQLVAIDGARCIVVAI